MRAVTQIAADRHCRSVAVTFDRNPEEVLHPSVSTPCITTLDQKLRLIEQQGIETAVVLPVEDHVLGMTAREFISEALCGKLSAVCVVVGTDFVFGRDRQGSLDFLRRVGGQYGFDVMEVHPVCFDGLVVSSTAIRELVAAGDIERADKLLGRPFALEGTVVTGTGRGRTLGFPTANLECARGQILPKSGVYAVSAILDGVGYPAAANIGARPTVCGEGVTVEVHIIGFAGDLYGKHMEVQFHHRLRDERRFDSMGALRDQIARDVAQVSSMMS